MTGSTGIRDHHATEQGMPEQTVWSALWIGGRTYPAAVAVTLVTAWTGFIVAVGCAGIGAIVGAVSAVYVLLHTISPYAPSNPVASGIGGSIVILTALGGAVAGAAGGFGLVYGGSVVTVPQVLIADVICGAILTLLVTVVVFHGERWLLQRYVYRRVAWEEAERLQPLLTGVITAMGLDAATLPPILIADRILPHAWVQMRAIVLTRGLMDTLDDDELAGVIAHELHHWRMGDPVGQRLVWAAAVPLVVLQWIALWTEGHRSTLVAFIGWFCFWPANVTVRFVVAPLYARSSRAQEYAADAGAAAAGEVYREGLKRALAKLSVIEAPRTSWEAALTRSHPPTALRLERLVSVEEAHQRAARVASWQHEQARRRADIGGA